MINTFKNVKVLMEQEENAQDKMGNFSKELEIIRKNKIKVMEINNV